MLECFLNFLVQHAVALFEVVTSLGMTDDNILHACVYQHLRRDLSCVGTFLLVVHILCTDCNVGAFDCLYNRYDIDCRNTVYNLNIIAYYERL